MHGLAFANPAARSLELFSAVARRLPATIIAAIRCETPEETFLVRQQLRRAKSEMRINSALSPNITLSLYWRVKCEYDYSRLRKPSFIQVMQKREKEREQREQVERDAVFTDLKYPC